MKTLDEYFPKSKNNHLGNKYVVLDDVDKPQTRHYLSLQCLDCGKQFKQRANSIFLGVISCLCSKSPRKSQEEYKDDVETKCKENGISLIRVVYKTPISVSRGIFKCDCCGGEWETSVASILYNSTGCLHCSKKYKPTLDEYVAKIEQALGVDGNLISHPEKITVHSRVDIQCNYCSAIYDKSVSKIIYGNSSCMCRANFGFNINMENFLYVLRIEKEGAVFHKIGITNNITRRVGEIARENNASVSVLCYWTYPALSNIRVHEQILKDMFCDSVRNNPGDIIQSGHTELVNNEAVPVVMAIQSLQRRNRNGLSS